MADLDDPEQREQKPEEINRRRRLLLVSFYCVLAIVTGAWIALLIWVAGRLL
jgi:hypothetical protein